MVRRTSVLAGVIAVSALASGCIPFGDPEGPGAAGNISLGAGVDASGFQTLVVRAVPDQGDPFDPAHPQFTGSAPDRESAWDADVESLEGATFPHPYQVGAVLGTTSQQRWRVFAWLSASADGSGDGPKTGEPFGTAAFDVDGCGGGYGGYCAVKMGVDLSIDLKAP
jgi:hypothetical protein